MEDKLGIPIKLNVLISAMLLRAGSAILKD
jgi:hypothetical protein